jgi:hypothetical protein
MKQLKSLVRELAKATVGLFILTGLSLPSQAQEIAVWQFRHVKQSDMQEFIDRETKYWSKVAEAALEKGNLTFWGLFVKQGGFDLENSPNVIFVNTFKDIDAVNMAETWNASAVFPDVPMDKMETQSMSTTMHQIFVRPVGMVTKEGSIPDEHYNYIRFIFHNSSNPGQLIALEQEHWQPFIKSAMEAGHTKQVAWGHSQILAPSQPNMDANTISYDVYPDMKSALTGGWAQDAEVEFPQEGLEKINDLELTRRYNNVYRRIAVVNSTE